MAQTYRAIQVTEPGRLELVERSLPEPGPGEVLIAVETLPLERAEEAYQRMRSGDVEFRMVSPE